MADPTDRMSPLSGVRALLFDVFGTVVDWQGSVLRQLEERVQEDGLEQGVDLLAFTQEWRAGYMRRTQEIANGAEGPTNIDVLHRELLEELLTNSKYSTLAEWDDSARSELVQFWHKLEGWPDSARGLRALHSLDPPAFLATLSNGSARLLVDLSRHASLKFDLIFSGDILNSYKPNPAMYLGACKLLGLEPGQVAMVAAHIQDLRAAASFGLKTIYVQRETEDGHDIEGFNGRDSVKSKAEGGEVDGVAEGLDQIARLLY